MQSEWGTGNGCSRAQTKVRQPSARKRFSIYLEFVADALLIIVGNLLRDLPNVIQTQLSFAVVSTGITIRIFDSISCEELTNKKISERANYRKWN